MPICSYVVFPQPGRRDELAERLAALPDCDVEPAANRDLLLLVTDTEDLAEEHRLQARLSAIDAIQCMVLTFGEIDPDTSMGDPIAEMERPKSTRPGAARAGGVNPGEERGANGSS